MMMIRALHANVSTQFDFSRTAAAASRSAAVGLLWCHARTLLDLPSFCDSILKFEDFDVDRFQPEFQQTFSSF